MYKGRKKRGMVRRFDADECGTLENRFCGGERMMERRPGQL